MIKYKGKIEIIGIITFLLLAAFSINPPVLASSLEILVEPESWYNSDFDDTDNWKAQSFIPSLDIISTYGVALSRTSSATGTFTVSIYDDDSGEPGSSVYTSSAMNINSIAVFPSWSWASVSHNVYVDSGETYYVMVKMIDDQSEGEIFYWMLNTTVPYSDGKYFYSPNAGSSWSSNAASDMAFRIYTNEYPTAAYSYTTDGLTIDVDASSSSDPDGTITLYQWDWTNDGSYDDTGETDSHTFSSSGTYTVNLRVIDNNGVPDTHSKSITVSSGGGGNQEPTAAFTTSTSGLTVDVDASGSADTDGTIETYSWDWTNNGGYDNSSALSTFSYTYSTAGTYTIKLRVTDNGSATDTVTHSVTVSVGGSSGFSSSDYTTYYYIIGAVAAALIIGAIVYYGPVKGKKGGKKR